MAATAISICSNARMLCGQSSISSFDEDSTGLAGNMWDTVRQSTLRLGVWSRVRKRASLPALPDSPAWGWTYQAIIPPDCLRVLSVGEGGEVPDFEIEGDRILSNEAAIKIRYVYDATNPATWDSVLIEATTMHMAAVMAYPLTGSKTLQDAMQANFAALLEAARGINSVEAPTDPIGDKPLFRARAGY